MALYHPSHSLCLVQAQPMKMMVSSKYIGFVVFLWYFFFLIWVLCCERSGDIDSKWRKWRKLCDIAWWKLLWRNSKSQVSLWSSLWLTWLLDPQALNTTNSTKIPSLYKTQRCVIFICRNLYNYYIIHVQVFKIVVVPCVILFLHPIYVIFIYTNLYNYYIIHVKVL